MIKELPTLDDDLLDEAWQLYRDAFHGVNRLAVQRHLMYRHEFDFTMHDPRILKYLLLDDGGRLAGLATYTNDLAAVPLISADYFARRWPDHYTAQRIWYIGFVCAAPRCPRGFGELVEALHAKVAATGGIVGLDFCSHSEQVRHLPRAVEIMLRSLASDVHGERADTQSYWLYEFLVPGQDRIAS